MAENRNKKELKIYLADIFARMSQVIFTLLVVSPFIANIFNWGMVIIGMIFFIIIVWVGAAFTNSIEEESCNA